MVKVKADIQYSSVFDRFRKAQRSLLDRFVWRTYGQADRAQIEAWNLMDANSVFWNSEGLCE